jgi:hypothetical protein
VTLIRSMNNDKVFGGYTSIAWSSTEYKWVRDEKAFLFSLTDGRKYEQGLLATSRSGTGQDSDKAVYHHRSNLVAFGAGHDLYIPSDSNKASNSYCNLSTTYASALASHSPVSRDRFLGGDYNFLVAEIETYLVLMSETPQLH